MSYVRIFWGTLIEFRLNVSPDACPLWARLRDCSPKTSELKFAGGFERGAGSTPSSFAECDGLLRLVVENPPIRNFRRWSFGSRQDGTTESRDHEGSLPTEWLADGRPSLLRNFEAGFPGGSIVKMM